MRTLVCWIGFTDLCAAGIRQAKGKEGPGVGPIGQALDGREFDEVVLLCDYPEEQGVAYVAWAQKRTVARVALRHVQLADPTHFGDVYRLADQALGEVRAVAKKAHQELELTLHVSPGTPIMGAAWVILGKTKFPAELIQTSREQGLQTTSIPLDIAAEFLDLIPALLRKSDASLESRSAGVLPDSPQFGSIVYRGRAMGEVIGRARRVAVRGVSVLIEGESGTGKELLARAIHQEGPRKHGPFVAVNCSALPENLVESLLFGHKKGAYTGADKDKKGFFREAQGGTLFLDEVGELPLAVQAKLLRALQEKEVTPVGDEQSYKVDARVIAATNRNLSVECRERRFREDLFYRLAIAVLHLPPLRERKGDLGLLIERLLDKANEIGAGEESGYERKVLSAGGKNLLLNHPWPGNVRELENTLMRATVWTDGRAITERDVRLALMAPNDRSAAGLQDQALGDGFNLDGVLGTISRRYFERALAESGGNKTKAAELLGFNNRQTLNNRMKAVGMPT